MYAISFVIDASRLVHCYSGSLLEAQEEVAHELSHCGFCYQHNEIYINQSADNTLTSLHEAINAMSRIKWFRECVHSVKAFRVTDLSDITDIIKCGACNKSDIPEKIFKR